VLRSASAGPEVLLVHRRRYGGDWSLPKGKLRRDEPWPVAAVRETREETGFAVRLGAPAGELSYQVKGRRKEVRFWVASVVGDKGHPTGDEVDACDWFALDHALGQMSYESERAVLAAAAQAPPTVSLIIARHAKATSRKQWRKADQDRPLTKRGKDQVARLTGLLAVWSPTQVVTSPALRCRDTIAQYAAATATTVEVEHLLSEEGHAEDPAAVKRFVLERRGGAQREAQVGAETGSRRSTGTVLCTHRPILPTIADTLGITLTSQDREEALPTAGCWVLHLSAEGAVIHEQHAG